MRGFGFEIDLKTGKTRYWYIDKEGIKRWKDNDQPITEHLETIK